MRDMYWLMWRYYQKLSIFVAINSVSESYYQKEIF